MIVVVGGTENVWTSRALSPLYMCTTTPSLFFVRTFTFRMVLPPCNSDDSLFQRFRSRLLHLSVYRYYKIPLKNRRSPRKFCRSGKKKTLSKREEIARHWRSSCETSLIDNRSHEKPFKFIISKMRTLFNEFYFFFQDIQGHFRLLSEIQSPRDFPREPLVWSVYSVSSILRLLYSFIIVKWTVKHGESTLEISPMEYRSFAAFYWERINCCFSENTEAFNRSQDSIFLDVPLNHSKINRSMVVTNR